MVRSLHTNVVFGLEHRFAETIFRTAGGRFLATAIVPALTSFITP